VLGGASVAVVYATGVIAKKPDMPLWVWVVSALSVWLGALVFSAFGLFIGYLLPSENVMQIIGFALMLCSFGGGCSSRSASSPTPGAPSPMFTPLWGLNGLVQRRLAGRHLQLALAGEPDRLAVACSSAVPPGGSPGHHPGLTSKRTAKV